MGLYFEFCRKSFLEKYTFRFDFFLSIVGGFLSILVQMSMWEVLYNGKSELKGFSLFDMMNYVMICLVIGSITSSRTGTKIASKVHSGGIISDLSKPINFKFYLWAEDLGENSFRFVFSVLPVMLLTTLCYGFFIEVKFVNLIFFIVSIILGAGLAFHINYLIGLLAFWLKNSWYVSWFLTAFQALFSGSKIPLWFYPDILYRVTEFLPFRYVFFDPLTIYLEKVSYTDALGILFIQAVWLVVLVFLEKIVWFSVQKKIFIFGG